MRFADFFQEEVGASAPFALPPEYVALARSEWRGASAEVLIASEAARAGIPLVTYVDALAALPVGYFLAGFAGYGVNSHSFYFCEVDALRRVFFRIPYGGAYEDRALERRHLLDFLRGYERTRARQEIRSLLAFEAPPNAHYEIEWIDGTQRAYTECLYPAGDFSVLLRLRSPGAPGNDILASLGRLTSRLRELATEGAHGTWSEAEGGRAWINLRRATEATLRALDGTTQGEGATEERALNALRAYAAEGVVSPALAERFARWVGAHGHGFPALLTPMEAIADLLVPLTNDLEALRVMLASRSNVFAPPAVTKRARAFLLGERRVELEYLADDRRRVVVDGMPIPMTLRETESTRTNAGYYDKELRAAHPVTAFGPYAREDESFEVERTKDGWRASCRWKASATAMYNTVMYDLESIELSFPLDCSSVAVVWDHHTDLSS